MKKNLSIILVSILLVISIAGIIVFAPRHGVIVYNCSIAEISPDMPVVVKEECRKKNRQ
jgi:cbb3-type cytochrome oxidase cytochrome c subunit